MDLDLRPRCSAAHKLYIHRFRSAESSIYFRSTMQELAGGKQCTALQCWNMLDLALCFSASTMQVGSSALHCILEQVECCTPLFDLHCSSGTSGCSLSGTDSKIHPKLGSPAEWNMQHYMSLTPGAPWTAGLGQ